MSYFCVTEFQCSSVLTLLYVHVSGCANLSDKVISESS